MVRFSLLLILVSCFTGIFTANILAVFPIPSVSHQIVYRALTRELNRRGHNLTVLTTDPINDKNIKNYTEVDLGYYYPTWNKRFDMASEAASILRVAPELFYWEFTDSTNEICELYLSDPNVGEIINRGETFDLVIVEFGSMPCFYAFADLAKDKKYIGMFSFSLGAIVQSNIGNTSPASYLPDPFLPYLDKMVFAQRLRAWIFQAFTWCYYWYSMNDHTTIVKKHFRPDIPHLYEFERNVSLIMTNTHFTTTFPRPAGPAYVDIGGPPFHMNGWIPKKLPKVRGILKKIYYGRAPPN